MRSFVQVCNQVTGFWAPLKVPHGKFVVLGTDGRAWSRLPIRSLRIVGGLIVPGLIRIGSLATLGAYPVILMAWRRKSRRVAVQVGWDARLPPVEEV